MLHRLIWKLQTGEDPGMIDHINGNRTDNRWENLRECKNGGFDNMQNIQKPHKDSFTQKLGVSKDKRSGKYIARIMVNGRDHIVGSYNTATDAEAAYLFAKNRLHPFANGTEQTLFEPVRKTPQKNNKTGKIGAWKRPNGRFQSRILVKGKSIHLGTFLTADEAEAAYLAALQEYKPVFPRSPAVRR